MMGLLRLGDIKRHASIKRLVASLVKLFRKILSFLYCNFISIMHDL